MNRRTLLAALASSTTAVGFAGCLTESRGRVETTERTATTTKDSTTASSGPPSTTREPSTTTEGTGASWQKAANTPDPEKRVIVENRGKDGDAHDVAVKVYHVDADEVVHDRTHSISAGERRIVYRTEDANPSGVDEFEVAVAFDGQRRTVTIETSECYGWPQFTVAADDELRAGYGIC